MKNIILFMGVFLSYTFCYCQTKKIEGIVNYIQTNSTYHFKSKLYFTTEKSAYKYNVIERKSLRKDNLSMPTELKFDTVPDEFGEITFIDFSKKNLLAREKVVGKSFIYEESLPAIKWKLSNESKLIGKFKCQKATTTFRGRNYVAWFTTEIPISMGPWKLNGLPGLILEAFDDTLQIQFAFESISMPENVADNMVFPSTEGRRITFEEHKTIFESTSQKVIAMTDIPKGTTVKIDIDKRVFFELSYDK
ncbi:GLPGLI family protein [Emticicia sp.]|uniref:GLPGLI family protein n=1 Tax=Emticicia sp. TaxID=1930953 RepID=UPI003753085A